MTNSTRHKCFISYHHGDPKRNTGDQNAVEDFLKEFGGCHDVFISRAVGIDQDVVDSTNTDYVMRRIREKYLSDSTVTIVMIGKCTWSRKYVDWEIASTLRNDPTNKRSGLVAIQLPNIPNSTHLPQRLKDNIDSGYAKYYVYPKNADVLKLIISEAFNARTEKASKVKNTMDLFNNNRSC